VRSPARDANLQSRRGAEATGPTDHEPSLMTGETVVDGGKKSWKKTQLKKTGTFGFLV